MNCFAYRGGLIEMARGSALGTSERRELMTHVEGCEACARFLDAQMELSAAAEALAAIEIPSHREFVARVMAEFDAAHPARVPVWRLVVAAGLAAAFVMGAVWIERQARGERPAARTEAADDRSFFNIPYTLPLGPEEPAALIRTKIPVNQLIAAGFHVQVSTLDPDAAIEADVLVGPDGRARAIRPVSISMSN